MIREFIAYKRIETARAKERCGCRWDLVPNSAPSEPAEPMADPGLYPRATLVREVGKARDLAAKKVGWAGSTAAVGEKVVNVIDRLQNEKKYEDVVRLRSILRDKTIQAAYRHAVEKGWLPKPVKRPRRKSGTHDRDDACNDGQAGGGQDRGAAGAGSVPAAEQESGNTPAPATCPDTPEVGSGLADPDINAVEVAPDASMDQPPAAEERATSEHLVDSPDGSVQENTPPPASETTACPSLADLASPAPDGQPHPVEDDSGVSPTAFVTELIPSGKVQKAISMVRTGDLRSSDGTDLGDDLRRMVPLVAALLNQCALGFPELEGRDISQVLGRANTKLQLVMRWA